LLNVTKANVWASIVDGRSFFARTIGSAIAERNSCGMKAADSRRMNEVPGVDEVKYKRVLYGEKLWR
jgi:hypothetical protein